MEQTAINKEKITVLILNSIQSLSNYEKFVRIVFGQIPVSKDQNNGKIKGEL